MQNGGNQGGGKNAERENTYRGKDKKTECILGGGGGSTEKKQKRRNNPPTTTSSTTSPSLSVLQHFLPRPPCPAPTYLALPHHCAHAHAHKGEGKKSKEEGGTTGNTHTRSPGCCKCSQRNEQTLALIVPKALLQWTHKKKSEMSAQQLVGK